MERPDKLTKTDLDIAFYNGVIDAQRGKTYKDGWQEFLELSQLKAHHVDQIQSAYHDGFYSGQSFF